MTNPEEADGEVAAPQWWLGYLIDYEPADLGGDATAYRCSGGRGCGSLVLAGDFDTHAKWHVVRLGRR